MNKDIVISVVVMTVTALAVYTVGHIMLHL